MREKMKPYDIYLKSSRQTSLELIIKIVLRVDYKPWQQHKPSVVTFIVAYSYFLGIRPIMYNSSLILNNLSRNIMLRGNSYFYTQWCTLDLSYYNRFTSKLIAVQPNWEKWQGLTNRNKNYTMNHRGFRLL